MDKSVHTPRAALFTVTNDGVFDYQRIVVGKRDDANYVADVAERLANAMVPLVKHHADCANCSELKSLHASWCEGDCPDEGSNVRNVLECLRCSPNIAVAEFRKTSSSDILKSSWYLDLFGVLNDIFPDGDSVRVIIEGPIGLFLSELLHIGKCRSIKELSDAKAVWLGKVVALSQLDWTDKARPEQWQLLHELLKDFEQEFFAMGRLDHVSRIVNAMCDGLVSKAIADIKALPDSCRQSGDDSGLKNVWDEFKYQVQGEQSIFFEFYEDTIRGICAGLVADLELERQQLLWVWSDGYFEWDDEEGELSPDTLADYVVKEMFDRLCSAAENEELAVDPDEERDRERYEEDMYLFRPKDQPDEDSEDGGAAKGN